MGAPDSMTQIDLRRALCLRSAGSFLSSPKPRPLRTLPIAADREWVRRTDAGLHASPRWRAPALCRPDRRGPRRVKCGTAQAASLPHRAAILWVLRSTYIVMAVHL